MNFIGIDPSLTGTGICVYSPSQADQPWAETLRSKPANGLPERFERYHRLVAHVQSVVRQAEPAIVCLEGYSFASKGAMSHDRVEYGSLLRDMLLTLSDKHCMSVFEVTPSTLKLFASGKGSADKVIVAAALVRRYGVEYGNDNEYDAFALARFAACIHGIDKPASEHQARALHNFRHPDDKIKPPRKPKEGSA